MGGPVRWELLGSSPHLRGNPTQVHLHISSLRVIPAPTGQPFQDPKSGKLHPGHPRTYGATVSGEGTRWVFEGSSPHLRGNPVHRRCLDAGMGVIPAPTGQPASTPNPVALPWGHPRTYGATSYCLGYSTQAYGSSPHLRGNPAPTQVNLNILRVIPAPTGQPRPSTDPLPAIKGHPRTYGATLCVHGVPLSDFGSSPHLRGNHCEK